MNFFSRRLALSLSLCNIASAGINFLAILFYSWFFGLADIGLLAIVTSVSSLFLPLITFRLDLAFHRLPEEDRQGLAALIVVWGAGVATVVAVIGLGAYLLLGWQSLLVVTAIPLHLMFSSANSAIWAQKVCDRRLSDVAVLQIVRSLLAAGLPFALATQIEGASALIYGQIFAQLTFLLFLPARKHFRLDRLQTRLIWTRTEARDLVVDNTLPLLVNSASLHLNPVLAATIFGPEAAAVLWMIFRLFLTPASLIADPVRRDFYANFTDGRIINRDVRRSLLLHKGVVLGLGILVFSGLWIASQFLDFSAQLNMLGNYPLIAALGVVWAGAILFNAPSSGLIPVLRMARIQTVFEAFGFIVRIGSLLLGLLGLPLETCLVLFLASTIGINLALGALIDWNIWRKSNTSHG